MANIVNNYCSSIITIYQEVKKKYEANLDVIKQAEEELSDLNHECELADPKNMYEGWKVYRAIREARIRRRTAKLENELLKDMYEYFSSQVGQSFKSKIQSIQGTSVKVRETQEARTYRPKQRSDLTISEKHSTASKPFEELLADFNKNKAYMKGGKLRK